MIFIGKFPLIKKQKHVLEAQQNAWPDTKIEGFLFMACLSTAAVTETLFMACLSTAAVTETLFMACLSTAAVTETLLLRKH